MAALLYGAGVAVNVGLGRWSRPAELRRRAGIAALSGAALLVVIALAALSLSDRGLTGTISDRVDELTSETETAPTDTGAGRFTAAASTRGKYWREARLVFEDRPSVGTGAGTFRVARLRHRTDTSVTGHAHGYVAQTLADLGLVGLGVSLLLLGAWLLAAARSTGIFPRQAQWSPDRIALVALALMAIVFGIQSAVDWTWFVPGPAAMALVAAGFVAGRGPARDADPDPAPAATPARAASSPAPPRLFAGRSGAAGRAALRLGDLAARVGRTGHDRRARAVHPGRRRRRAGRARLGRRREPPQRRGAARPGGGRDPGRQDRGRGRDARGGGAEVPRRAHHLVPAGRLPARNAGPARGRGRDRAGSALPRPALGAGAQPLPGGEGAAARAAARGPSGPRAGGRGPAGCPSGVAARRARNRARRAPV